MSGLRLTTISNQAGTASVPSETVINGSAKAWVNFNGTGTVAIRASYNVSSITDLGTGYYTINFTTAMPDTSYSTLITAQDDGLGNANGVHTSLQSTAYTASGFTLNQYSWAGSYIDLSTFCAAVFR
jgi:hypothetical protein